MTDQRARLAAALETLGAQQPHVTAQLLLDAAPEFAENEALGAAIRDPENPLLEDVLCYRLTGFLWPDSSVERVRAALTAALKESKP